MARSFRPGSGRQPTFQSDYQLPSQLSRQPTFQSQPPSQLSRLPTFQSQLPSQLSRQPTFQSQLPSQPSRLPTFQSQLPSQPSRLPTFQQSLQLQPGCSQSVGGYNHTFVDEIAAKYHCNICSKVLRDARLTVCCGQHYCDSCLKRWSASKTQNKETCPHCREEGFEHVLDKSVIREINEFRVKCTNHEEGCGWVGELGDLEKHIESENGCGYEMVECNNFGHFFHHVPLKAGCPAICSHWCQRQSLAEHQKTCKYRPYQCEYCGIVDTYDAIAGEGKIFLHSDVPINGINKNHYSSCEQYPVECPNKCREKTIKRCDIPSHREQCPLEPLPCPFKNVGCSSMISRCDMYSHCQTNMQTHLLMMAKSHDELLHKNNELLQKNEEFVFKNQELAQKVGELAHKNEELDRQCEQFMRRLEILEARHKPLLPF